MQRSSSIVNAKRRRDGAMKRPSRRQASRSKVMPWIKKSAVAVSRHGSALRIIAILIAMLLIPRHSFAQASPWENAVNVLRTSFTGAIARGLSLVAIVVGGLLFAFGEGDSKRALAGIVFGVGMAVGAVTFMAWLFP
jgi:type IV secretory pathway VirB2 component (pilin)